MANSTPMFSTKMMQQMQQPLVTLPTTQQKTAQVKSTTPTNPTQTDPTSLGAYKGVPIKYGDQTSILAQMKAIDASQPGAKPAAQNLGGGLMPTAQAPQNAAASPAIAATAIGSQNGAKPGIIPAPKSKAQEVPTFSGILYDLIKKATEGDKNVQRAREDLTKFQTNTADKIAAIRSEPIALEFQQGRAQAVQQASAEKEKAFQTGVENALTSQGQTLNALNQAAGLASPQQLSPGNVYIDPATGKPIAGGPTQVSPGNVVINPLTGQPMAGAPTQVPYQNQFLDPLTGKPVGGGNGLGGGGMDVSSVAQQVIAGQMSPSQAYDIFGNNLAFNNAINQEIRKTNPQFNFIQAEANAAAQGQALTQATERGGDLQKRGDTVIQHIAQLQSAYNTLKGNTPSPYLNMGMNLLKGAYPSPEFQSYLTALDNVRGELAGIFSVGGTPSEGEAMAKRILPDGATPAQIEGALDQARNLIHEKISSYSTPTAIQYGAGAGSGGQAGGGGMWDW